MIRMFSFIFSHVFCFLGSCDLLFLTNVIHEHIENKDKNIQSESFLSFYTLLCFFCVFHVLCFFSSAKVALAFVLVFSKTTLVCSSRNLQLQLVINVRIW